MSQEISDKIKQIISTQLDVPLEDIKDDSHLMSDLGADSLDAVELTMSFEDEFGIDISDQEAEKLLVVSDIVKYVESKGKS